MASITKPSLDVFYTAAHYVVTCQCWMFHMCHRNGSRMGNWLEKNLQVRLKALCVQDNSPARDDD